MVDVAQAYCLKTDENGVSLYEHLAELLQSIDLKDPNALAEFESKSLDIKAARFKPTVGVKTVAPEIEDLTTKTGMSALFTADFDEEGAGLPNVVEELAMFEHAGVGFAREEGYRLFLAMAQLKQAHGLASIRLFGKVLGTQSDYYVVEGKHATPPTPPSKNPSEPELPGAGLNECVYFVASGVAGAFEQLPDVRPEQVAASLRIKKLFTGDLGAPVACYPPFPGVERDYLRTQIARIAQATVLVPTGKFAVTDADEGYEPKAAADYLELDNWSRWYGGLLKTGRLTHPPKPEAAEGEEEEEGEPPEDEVPPLSAVSGDAPVSTLIEEHELPAWTSKLYAKQAGFAIAVAKSHRWPGAFSAVSKGFTVNVKNAEGETAPKSFDKAANLYIGYGYENAGQVFTPVPPPGILGEAADVEEQPDVSTAEENALLKAIDDAKRVAEETPAEEEEE